MNAIMGGSQERAVYIGDNSKTVLRTKRTEARTLDTVKGAPATLCTPPLALSAPLRGTRELTVRKLNSFKAKARALARSGYFYGLTPLEFELSFEEGFHEAREWLELASTKEELEHLCQESRKHKAA